MSNLNFNEVEEALASLFVSDTGLVQGVTLFYGQLPDNLSEISAVILGSELPRTDSQEDAIMLYVSQAIGRYQLRSDAVDMMSNFRNAIPKQRNYVTIGLNKYLFHSLEPQGNSNPYKVQHNGEEKWEFSVNFVTRLAPNII